MLIDCTFKRDDTETQAMVVTRDPIIIGETIQIDQLSHYLYIKVNSERDNKKVKS
jgi:hypothetical protein